MFDPRDLLREDTPTPRPARAATAPDDQARPGASRQDGPAREDRARDQRAGHHTTPARRHPRRATGRAAPVPNAPATPSPT